MLTRQVLAFLCVIYMNRILLYVPFIAVLQDTSNGGCVTV